MQREAILQTNWCDLTLTALREKQYEACERRLAARPGKALFGRDTTEADAQALLEHSFYACPGAPLTTLRALREKVLRLFPREVLFLSSDEFSLLEKLVLTEGPLEISDWNDIAAAEGLMNRLWCGYYSEGGNLFLTLPGKLRMMLPDIFASERCAKTREMLSRYEMTLDGLLYLEGILQEDVPMEILLTEILHRHGENSVTLARRYLQTSYDYQTDASGRLILLHPGLADTQYRPADLLDSNRFYMQLPQDLLQGAMQGILPEEIPLHEALCGVMIGAARPDFDIGESAEDLRILVKQGISFEDLKKVFSSMLMTLPTERMISVLRELHLNTPRWLSAKPALLN